MKRKRRSRRVVPGESGFADVEPRRHEGREGFMAKDIEEIATIIVDAAIKVHRALGPGLLESAYQHCLAHELRKRGLHVETEVAQPVMYDGECINVGYRLDMLVENVIVIENKTVEDIAPIHEAQLLTYLKLRQCRLGFLLNWNVFLMKHGIHRKILTSPKS